MTSNRPSDLNFYSSEDVMRKVSFRYYIKTAESKFNDIDAFV